MVTKVCFRCKKEKNINEFHKNKRNTDGHKGICKQCCRLYVDEHIKEKRQYEKEHREKYKHIQKKSSKKYRDNNVNKLAESRKSENYKKKQNEWRKKNKERIKENQRKYYENNKEKWKSNPEGRRKRENRRYREDEEYNFIRKMRSRAYKAMRGCKKETSVLDILGCTFMEFKKYFISLFDDGMTWDLFLQGEIHEDHIIPVNAFDMKDSLQQKACFYYKNYQPLWRSDNLKKRCAYKEKDYKAYMDWYIGNVHKKSK